MSVSPKDTHMPEHAAHSAGTIAVPQSAIAVMHPTEGYDVKGYVFFEKVDDGIRVSGRIENLTPGKHGFHVHEYVDLRQQDGLGTGGHFDSKGRPHGPRESHERHVGDLGNIVADETGVAEFSFVDHMLRFQGPASIIGRGLIVHADEDDLHSQPTGDAGGRVSMGVIGIANPEASARD